MQKYSINQHLIEHLLTWVDSGEIAIPEIQRPFVWDATQVRDLIDSLYRGYPVGYIIVWKNPAVRLKDGTLSDGRKVLIDGQQRITALSASFAGRHVINKDYRQSRIQIAFNPVSERFEVRNAAIDADPEWIPDIAPAMSGQMTLLKLVRTYTARNPELEEDHLERVLTQLLGILKKQLGVIELAADLDIETVTEIFIRINREGVSLGPADFVMSKIASNDRYGGSTLRKAIDYFCHLAVAPEFYSAIEENDREFAATDYFQTMRWLRNENDDLYDPSYSDMLRVVLLSQFERGKLSDLVALLSGRNFETRAYEESIAGESFARLREGVLQFMREHHFKQFLMILTSAGFIDSSLLPFQGPINFAYALYLHLRRIGLPAADIERGVRRWFVMSLLTQRYSGSAETRFDQDIAEIAAQGLHRYLKRLEQEMLTDVFWNAQLPRALETSNARSAAFRCFLAAQARDHDRGFLSRDIRVADMLTHKGDIHHIYPKQHLKRQGLTRSQYNQVANLVYTQTEVNIAIGADAPSQYIARVVEQCNGGQRHYGGITNLEELRRNFSENAIPLALLERPDLDYATFLEDRRRLMAQRLRSYYQSL